MRNKIIKKRIVAAIAAAVISVAAIIPSNTVSIFCAEKGQEITAVDVESAVPVKAGTQKVTGTYHQTEARKLFKKVNKFRTGKDAYYNGFNGEKVYLPNLKPYVYDYELERMAMIRAAEVAVLPDHKRPNGNMCGTILYDELGYDVWGNKVAENIALERKSAKQAMKALREDGLSYANQGHRINMLLEDYVSCGCACFEVDGKKYWVQLFGHKVYDSNKTSPNNSSETVFISVK